ncbi:phosphatase [Candidatus Poribacteria bacterium]|nr:phosphatase [Candidatus Poribacteria bacterium]
MAPYRLVVFDMAGTTVRDDGAVEAAFLTAAAATGLRADRDAIHARRGLSKKRVFRELWRLDGVAAEDEIDRRADASHAAFRAALEEWVRTRPIRPTDGCLDCFGRLRAEGILIALTTGFYRGVTDIILSRLGWDRGLDDARVGIGVEEAVIQASVCSGDVAQGRPAPDMIHRAMRLLSVHSAARVVKVGDTPADLQAGRNAACGLTLAVTSGSHTAAQLADHANDGLLASLCDLPSALGI